jgi:hypothetical protein
MTAAGCQEQARENAEFPDPRHLQDISQPASTGVLLIGVNMKYAVLSTGGRVTIFVVAYCQQNGW